MAAFLAKMAQEKIHRPGRGAKARVHFHQDRRHRGPERHLRHMLTVRELKALNQTVCHPENLFICTPLPCVQFFNLVSYANDHTRDNDFIPDLLTDEGLCPG